MNTYITDWRSSGDTSEDYWRTWNQLYSAHWDGHRREAAHVVPLDALKIHIVGALLKVGGYRSAHNYLGVAKTKHVELGYSWGPELELAARRFNLSTRRGAGPPRQSEPLNFELIAATDHGWDPLVSKGPVNTNAIIVLFTFFMIRELDGGRWPR